MKPEPKIYEAVERITGERGKSILFLDDRKENVATGSERGWQVIHHSSPRETVAALKHLKVLGEMD
jgi:FMN phosphatase YigB (HAD superfamily)